MVDMRGGESRVGRYAKNGWRRVARTVQWGPVAAVLLLGAVAGSSHVVAQPTLRRMVGTTVTATVTSVVDGDTVHVQLTDRSDVRVRLDGIDAPERGEPFSAQTTRATRALLFTQAVSLTGTDVDRYGRLVARLRVDGVDASVQLVREGLACHFTRYSSDPELARAQVDAQRRGAGFWAPGAQRPACANGAREASPPGATVGPYHGNTSSRVFHVPSCRNYACKKCTAVFATREAAESAGFRPAGDCLR